jgi:hypothetical protein
MNSKPAEEGVIGGSFRDPSGFVYLRDGVFYRQLNPLYRENYEQLRGSGLYDKLVADGLLVPHEECELSYAHSQAAYKILRPSRVPFISYPYEWCFGELKDAALTTLRIQKRALECGMSLKDCSAFNIQFVNARPILIDTCSFETYRDGSPWVAYRQFCQHFLSPLVLMAYTDVRLGQMGRLFIDGFPLDLTVALLPPMRACLSFNILFHIYFHSICQRYYGNKRNRKEPQRARVSLSSLLHMVESLEIFLDNLKQRRPHAPWALYYSELTYSDQAFTHKQELVLKYLDILQPETVWDFGANTGIFSRIASKRGILTVSIDADPACVENNYLKTKQNGESHLLPLVMDLVNPSPSIGWAHKERLSLAERGPAQTVFALALIHHLAIGNNVPLGRIAQYFRDVGQSLIIEFVPKTDVNVQRLLETRVDIFADYTQSTFEREFTKYFSIERSDQIAGSGRTLYLMRRNSKP